MTNINEIDAIQLMEQYHNTRDTELRNRLVLHYSYIAKTVAAQMRGYTANYAQMEDIVQQGIITLMDCIEKFDVRKGVKFESYAFMRVKNANIDFIRKQDWLPRRVRKTAKDIAQAETELSNQLMREPTVKELAQHLSVPADSLHRHYNEMANSVMMSLEVVLQNSVSGIQTLDVSYDVDQQPEERIFKKELRSELIQAIDSLSERERLVVSLYYYEHLRLYEIAEVLGVSESRVCQLHAKAISKMKTRLEQYMCD